MTNGLRVNDISPVGERPGDRYRGRVGYIAGVDSLVGIEMVGTLADGQVWVYDAGSGTLVPGYVEDLGTAETDTTKRLAPDGAGGVDWVAKEVVPAFATPAIVLGTAAAAGVATTVIRSDATILAFDATVPVSSAEGDVAATGSATVAARRDHKHGREAFGSTAAAIGTSAGGSAATPSKSDHVHATGAGTPSTQAIGDAASTGSGPAAAMTDHKHAITNPLSAQDDLWLGGASGAPARLGKGSDGQVLTVDPTTHHLVWATPSGAVTFATPSGGYGAAAAGSGTDSMRATAVLPKPTESDLSLTAGSSVNDVNTTTHGLAPTLPNDANKFLNGVGGYSTPAGTSVGYPSFSGCKAYNSVNQTIANNRMFLDSEEYDTDSYHFPSSANLTGTCAKAAGSTTIVGTGTLFTTELAVNQVFAVPGTATEKFVVKSITDNTHVVVWVAAVNTASGQTGVRVNTAIAIPLGKGGYFIVTASAYDASGSADRRFYVNNVQIVAGPQHTGSNGGAIACAVHLNDGDYIEVDVGTGGANHTILASSTNHFSLTKVA